MVKTKLFQQQIHLKLLDAKDRVWSLSDASVPIDEQIAAWLKGGAIRVVSTSAPGYQAVWADESKQEQIILVGVVVLYVEEDPNAGGGEGTDTAGGDFRGLRL